MEKILRFAPLIRVSTEKQKLKGESLRTQETQIRKYVELLHHVIPEHCWKYKGQEHATPNQERALLDQLLADSSKDLFDAVIVTDSSRWSRDNMRNEIGLNTLCDNGIKFFVGPMEFDLHNPEHRFILTMNASINQLVANKQSTSSILNRIERAKRGWNSAGILPYGRKFDPKTGLWGIEDAKKLLIEKAAKRYLAGEHIPAIASTLNMNASNLHRILTKHSGPTRTTTFKYKNIKETVTIKIPELLDEKTREEIKNKIFANTTTRGKIQKHYLLVGYLFCSKCGLRLMSRKKPDSGMTYYRHSKNGKVKCFSKFAPAIELENAVLIQLLQTFSDPDKIELAIHRATPDTKELDELAKEKEILDKEFDKINKAKDQLIEDSNPNNPDHIFTRDEIKGKMIKYRLRQDDIQTRLNIINPRLELRLDKKEIKKRSIKASAVISNALRNNPKIIFNRTYEWKRKLIERAFSGKDSNGHQLGIYIDYQDNKFTFELRGLIEPTVLSLPLTDEYLIDAFNIDSEYQDVTTELKELRKSVQSNIQSKYTVYSARRILQ